MDNKQKRFTDKELDLIKGIFKNNEDALKVLRKVFLPTYDFNAPLGQVVDLWMTIPPTEVTPEYAYINWKARNQLINHIEQMLIQLQVLANEKEETEDEKKARLEKNSTK